MSNNMNPTNEPIAVIGSGCRFPGESTSPSKLWDLLQKPRDVLRKIDRFNPDAFYHANGHHHGTSNVRDSYLLTDDPRAFDPQFFSIQGGEAESIDPQQRLLLETMYEAIESAGLTIESLQGTPTAVYVGVMCDDYAEVIYHDSESIPKYAATGSARSIMSNRISYFFDWHGPSMTIDTACSSSLVAVHQALQTLRSGESRVAVAAGANLIFGPKMYIAESNVNMLSPTGRSRMWDADADGYARGEGIASIVLKTLSNAIADGDHIECIIRETGVNQDGRTTGITMPSSTAQAELIRSTYARAGLDLSNSHDRCQYFEAHGTGTKAGDPQEAEAIFKAFFSDRKESNGVGSDSVDDTLYVGSIKTIIGHTEGTAGLAGLLKASLAVQNRAVPPNMHFNRLNPDLEPFYGHLKVPTELQAWPALPKGTPRRASVNSFGFGGTNAHAIIESYEPNDNESKQEEQVTTTVTTPFTFSATSERSLTAQLTTYLSFLRETPALDLQAMSWTLSRRSAFNFRASFSALTVEELCSKIEVKLEEQKPGSSIATRPVSKGRGIIGIFTGQGAQWAAMGRELISSSKFVENIVDQLEQSLAELPDHPSWSLKEEILASPESSRLNEGRLSQPVCTAVQVVLVELLHHAGLKFDSVVGHSSGEIGAAYSAGFISARDAIRIAYYRGVYTELARGPQGEVGAMLAAGTSMEDAQELCDDPGFIGKLQVAASNSSASVTLSGDVEVIKEASAILEDEGKFARLLKVDTAYHSHHMLPCSGPYLQSLKNCNIQIRKPSKSASRWYSSVLGGEMMEICDELKDTYWVDNMLKPVLFSQALAQAVTDDGAPAIAIEVGPHPALRGPASLTIEETLSGGIPYIGTLSRGISDVESVSEALGFVWKHLGPSVVNFDNYDRLFSNIKRTLSKDIPSYTWDHERTYWSEARVSKALRWREETPHELLGVRTADNSEGEYRWRNYIKPVELPWLKGHQIQGQILFPAAGFAVMAVEASKVLAPADQVCLVELHNFSIHRALSFNNNNTGVEIMFILSNMKEHNAGGQRSISADFACHACPNKDAGRLISMADGRVELRLGEASLLTLPERPPPVPNMAEIDVDLFYASLTHLGYDYSDMFRGIASLRRTTDTAAGIILAPQTDTPDPSFSIHPATLDVAFQAIFAAIGSPGDGRLWTLHVPTMITKIQINPFACPSDGGIGVELPFDASLNVSISKGISGDVDIFDKGGHAIVQVEGLHVSPLTAPTGSDDRQIFAETIWDVASPDAEVGVKEWVLTDIEEKGSLLVERTCLFYMKRLHETITTVELEACDWHQKRVMDWAAYTVALTSEGKHPTCRKEWLDDTYEDLHAKVADMAKLYDDFNSLVFVGERLVPFVRGELSFIEQFRENNMLEHFYRDTYGFPEYNVYLGRVAKQITHRYRHMDILEIGAGTGSSTSAILKQIGDDYSSYTYTDISAGFFEEAQELFKDHSSKFIYKPLNAENDVTTQGFAEHSYDMVVASNVLHATRSLEETLANARRLLKPGGYLLLFEITNNEPLRIGFMFSGIPGWWVGGDDNRVHSPLISQKSWDSVLRKTGFSGIDTATPDSNVFLVPFSIMATQAIDTQMNLIRQPLSLIGTKAPIENLLILGGQTLPTSRLVEEICTILKPLCSQISVVDSLELLESSTLSTKPTILSLTELDVPFFNPFTEEKLNAAKSLFDLSKNVLWVIQGSRGDRPFANMMVGVARCLVAEMPDLRLQFLDVDVSEKPSAQNIAETLLRLQISDSWKSSKEPYRPLWTVERELSLSKGTMQIPRYIPNAGPNDRFNSAKRIIRKDVVLTSSVVAVASSELSYDLQESGPPNGSPATDSNDTLTIEVKRSILSAVKIKSIGYLYLVFGVVKDSGNKVIALSKYHRSIISVPKRWATSCEVDDDKENQLFLATANELLAQFIIGDAPRSSIIHVHEPTLLLATILKRQATSKGIQLVVTTVESGYAEGHRLHAFTPERKLELFISKNTTVFIDLSANKDTNDMGARIERRLPSRCKRRNAALFFSPESFTSPGFSEEKLSTTITISCAEAASGLTSDISFAEAEEIALNDIPSRSIRNQSLQIVNWTAATNASVRLVPAELDIMFRADKTYFMIGLTGELGLSLCQWMVNRGARFIALTSRNPKVDQGWLDMIQAMGAVIKVFSMDVTSKDSVLAVHKAICDTLPPIIGVANAAMVLIDGLFANISHENFTKTLRPKVDGSIFLNELFPGNELDFFILFSSLASVTGNIGQTPYAAANSFMVSMIAGRRKNGIVGSVMNLAGIFGLGYITRTDKSILDRLGNMGYANISEWDFHQFFAEAVLAGHPKSGRSPELSAGLQSFDPEHDLNPPAWLNIPKFSHYRLTKALTQTTGSANKGSISVRLQLAEQTTEEGAYQVILDGLLATLYHQLHLSPEDSGIFPDTAIVELGVDSLVAVDMRSWFTNELDIDMPVLKILGGATVAALVEDAVKRLPRQLIPNVISDTEPPKVIEAAVDQKKEYTDSDQALTPTSQETQEFATSPEESLQSISGVAKDEYDDVDVPLIAKPVFERVARMSYGSERFWFLRQYLEEPTTFNLLCRTSLTGSLQESDLERAVKAVGQRHEAFRTAFFANSDNMNEPTQGVLASSLLRLEKRKISRAEDVTTVCEDLMHYPFDLERGECIRILLLSLTPTSHFLIFGFHHIAIDGFSFNILLSELNTLYGGNTLPPVSCQFTDFALKQRKAVTSGAMAEELKFWREQFPDFPEPLPLFPMAKVNSRLALRKYDFEEAEIVLDSQTTSQVRELCRRNKSTTFHFYLTVLKILLFRFLDVEDLCIGMADANRTDNSTTGTIGFLLNLLPLRFKANPNQSFKEGIEEARNKAYTALAHSRLPFDILLENLDIPRSSTHSPLFQVFLDYRQLAIKTPKLLGAEADGVSSVGKTAYDLVLDINEIAGSEVKIGFRMQKYMYSKASTDILLKSYIRLVKLFASGSDVLPDKVQLYDPLDIKAAIVLGRGRSLDSVWPATISHRVDDMVIKYPESIAVKDGVGNILTYSSMAERVSAIYTSLAGAGLGEGANVAVFQEPTSDWICSLLAIWKIGGIYVPLELRNSLPRLAIIVNACQPSAILCHEPTEKDVPRLGAESAKIINITTLGKPAKKIVIQNQAKPQSPAVILYTSGSTGTPKGIILRHSSIRNEIEGYTREWNIEREIVLQQSAYSFDFSLDQIFSGLANGGTLYVVPKSKRGDPIELAKLIATENITYTKATPSEYSSLLQYGSSYLAGTSNWKFAFGGGEPLTDALKQNFRDLQSPGLRLFNSYGPGEVTISCTKAEIDYRNAADAGAPIPAGFALPNYSIFVVDKNLEPVPVGVSGEILIGGRGPAIGYLNNEELTKAKFIPDVYTPQEYVPEARGTVYRSGDMGHLQSDGSLIFEGRIDGDTQIKLRGIRIELEDIENTIIEAAGGVLSKAVVSVRGDPQFLVAHAEFSTLYPSSERSQFLKVLSSRLPLPQYMRPAMIIPLDTIPLNSHSKTNRLAIQALLLPQQSSSSNSDGILTKTEQALRDVWKKVVSSDIADVVPIDESTDFFYFGGNSLLLVKLQTLIRENFHTVLPMVELFEASTLRNMASKIDNASSVEAIDWKTETALEVDVLSKYPANTVKTVTAPFTGSGLTVILTGATGFLGSHILRQLVADKRVANIHCVAIRQEANSSPRKMPIESAKIVTHTGNLTEPLIGLSEATFTALASEGDVIIHSGANRAFWDYYHLLRGSNFLPTRELVKLAAARKIPIHLISSGGVLQLDPSSAVTSAVTMSAFAPPVDGSMGYVASKWASEIYLENAAKSVGLSVNIHRVTPATNDGHATAGKLDELLEEFSDLATQMKTLPSQAGWDGNFDLISVRSLAQQICSAALNTRPRDHQHYSPVFTHHQSDINLRMQDVVKYLEAHEGKDSFERLPPHKWVGRAKGLGVSYHFASQDFVIGKEDGLVLKR